MDYLIMSPMINGEQFRFREYASGYEEAKLIASDGDRIY